MNLMEKFTTLRLENSEVVVDYLTRAEYVSTQLELAGQTVTENMIRSIVLKGLPRYFKTLHNFSKDKATFAADVEKGSKFFENSRNDCGAWTSSTSENAALFSNVIKTKRLLNTFRAKKKFWECASVVARTDTIKPNVKLCSATFAKFSPR